MNYFYSAKTNGFYPESLKPTYDDEGKWPDDALKVTNEEWKTYGQGQPPEGVQRVADKNGRPAWVTIPPDSLDTLAARKRSFIETARKDAESEGVTVHGVRYAGDPGNRQAIMEVLDLITATGQESIASWKDSDGRFHADHPVADVREALMAIATRRGELISREGELNALIDSAVEDEDREALEAIEWSNTQ